MTWFMLPAGIALFLKWWILFNSYTQEWVNKSWLSFVAVLAMLNFSELLIYAGYFSGQSLNLLLKSYYVCCVTGLVYGYFYVKDSTNYSVQKYLSFAISATGIVLIPIILFSDTVVGGYAENTVPVAAIKGKLFWTFEIFTLLSVVASVSTLFYNYAKSKDPIQQIAYAYTIAGLLLLAVSVLTIIVLMILGINANGTGIIPIATTLFLLITVKGKNTHLIAKDPRKLNPLSAESAMAKQIEWAQTQMALNKVGLKEAVTNIEAALIHYKLDKNDGNISETARQFGVARSTINKKLERAPLN